jgi:hypothetical protein
VLLDPVKREQPGHMLVALLCLALSALAVALSFLNGLPILLSGR